MKGMKYTLITGASEGLGREFAKIAACEGKNLILVARGREKLVQLQRHFKKRYGISCLVFVQDLSKEDAADILFSEVQKRGIFVEALINNAGFGHFGIFVDTSWEVQKQLLTLNMVTLAHLCHLFGGEMKKRGEGKILNVASVAAYFPGPRLSTYYASKAFVLSFSLALSREMAPFHVTVTALCVGPVATGFERHAGMKKSNMFRLLPPAKAGAVAKRGYLAMVKGKPMADYDWLAKGLNLAGRLFGRNWAGMLSGFANTCFKAQGEKK